MFEVSCNHRHLISVPVKICCYCQALNLPISRNYYLQLHLQYIGACRHPLSISLSLDLLVSVRQSQVILGQLSNQQNDHLTNIALQFTALQFLELPLRSGIKFLVSIGFLWQVHQIVDHRLASGLLSACVSLQLLKLSQEIELFESTWIIGMGSLNVP
jgi:hypothetical protein